MTDLIPLPSVAKTFLCVLICMQLVLQTNPVLADVSEVPVVCRLSQLISTLQPPDGIEEIEAADLVPCDLAYAASSDCELVPLQVMGEAITAETVVLNPMIEAFADVDVAIGGLAEEEIVICNVPAMTEKITPVSVPGSIVREVQTAPVQPAGVDTGYVATTTLQMTYKGFQDGILSPRQPHWRPYLLEMLVQGTKQTQFDTVFLYLLASFPGNDGTAKLVRLRQWAETLDARAAGDVLRAETRYWLNAGEYDRAIAVADRMAHVRPDYRIRAYRLKALANASAGQFKDARVAILSARKESPPLHEKAELLYLEAWMDMQEGNVEKAKAELMDVINLSPSGASARKARTVLRSLSSAE